LDELVELRKALADLKKHAEKYADESKKASVTLEKLSRSLRALKALKVYRRQT
jgi:hypothetical protein